jgi:hypothetical protein
MFGGPRSLATYIKNQKTKIKRKELLQAKHDEEAAQEASELADPNSPMSILSMTSKNKTKRNFTSSSRLKSGLSTIKPEICDDDSIIPEAAEDDEIAKTSVAPETGYRNVPDDLEIDNYPIEEESNCTMPEISGATDKKLGSPKKLSIQ